MDWTEVDMHDVLAAIQQAENKHPMRPWGDFFNRLSMPKNTNKAISRIKCNLYYYRANYTVVILGSMIAVLIRNPIGMASLGLLAGGGLLFVNAFAKRASTAAMQLIHKAKPRLAVRIRSQPGGHDGSSVPPGRQSTIKVAGVQRNVLAGALLAVGATAALWTGVSTSLLLGSALGLSLTGAHSVMRTPNLKAKLSSHQTTDYSRP